MTRARRRVRIPPVHARRHRGESGELRLEAERVQLLQRPRDLAHRERARAVRAVAVDDATRVDRDEDARLDRSVARHRMRRRGRRAAATTASNESPSAPASRKLRSTHHASSFSLRPLKRSLASAAKISSESALARRMLAISSASLTARNPSTRPVARHRVDPRVDERAVQRVREVLLLELDPPARRGARRSRG